VVFAPDGKTLAFAESLWVTLLDRDSGKTTAAQKHGNSVGSLAFSPDGKVLASGGTDGLVKVWSVKPPKEKFVIDGHVGAVDSVQFAPDGKTLLTTGSGDGRFQIWDAATGKSKGKYEIPTATALVVSPDGALVAAANGNTVKLLAVPAK
jgi:WD40 repeat protein